jgi:Zn-dependent protease
VSGIDPYPDPEPFRGYEPIQPRSGFRDLLRKIWAPIAALLGIAVKFGFLFLKFAALFVSVGAYALIWGWRFGVGIVVLILVHEMGHYIVAKQQGLDPGLPMFIPFFGAYVQFRNTNPWKHSIIVLAGPFAGGLGAAACLLVGDLQNSDLLRALAYFGFFLNLVNLIPIGILDGGAILRCVRLMSRGGGRGRAYTIGIATLAVAALLVLGMAASHVHQTRL